MCTVDGELSSYGHEYDTRGGEKHGELHCYGQNGTSIATAIKTELRRKQRRISSPGHGSLTGRPAELLLPCTVARPPPLRLTCRAATGRPFARRYDQSGINNHRRTSCLRTRHWARTQQVATVGEALPGALEA